MLKAFTDGTFRPAVKDIKKKKGEEKELGGNVVGLSTWLRYRCVHQRPVSAYIL